IAGLGGPAAWPVVARAQQPTMPVIGFLSSASNAPPGLELTPKGFRAGLNEAGYFVGRNVTIEVFLANGRYDRLPALADEMVRRQVRLIVAAGGVASARAAKAATAKIPIPTPSACTDTESSRAHLDHRPSIARLLYRGE